MRRFTVALVTLGLVACTEAPKEEPKEEEPTSAAEPAPPPEPADQPAYVTVVSGMRKTPSDAKRIDDPTGKSKKKVSNYMTLLYRGEEVTTLGSEGEWTNVQISDESTGWLKTKYLIMADEVSLAANVEELKLFRRPDVLAINAKKTVEPGSLLYVKKAKNDFSEVDYSGWASGWVQSGELTTDSQEIAAAKALGKIRHMRKEKEEGLDDLVKLATDSYKDTKISALFELPPEEAAPEGDEAAPTEEGTEEEDTGDDAG